MFEIMPLNHRNHINTYNPFRDWDALENAFFGDRFFRDSDIELFKTDIKEKDGAFVLEADLPGFDKKDINIDVNGDYLTIKAERHSEHEDKEKKNSYIRCERSYGSYCRSFDVTGIDTEKIAAKYDNGVLTLTMPRKEPQQPASRQLTIE